MKLILPYKFFIYIYILGDGENGYDLDTSDDSLKGSIDSILGVRVQPTTYTVTQVQTVYATVPPSIIAGLPTGPDGSRVPGISYLPYPDNRFILPYNFQF